MIPDSVRLKIDWAKKHIDALDAEIAKWSAGPPNPRRLYRIRHGVPPTEFRAKVRFDPPLPDAIPLLIGDAVHNLRSTLDHLACALANLRTPTTSETGHAGIEFPIYSSEQEFNAKGASRIQKLPAAAQDQIKSLQPYQAGNNARHQFLWALHRLDIIDKHRRIPVLGARCSLPDSYMPRVGQGDEFVLDGRRYVPFKDGQIIRIIDVDPEFQPDITGTVAIRFGDRHDEVIEYGALRFIHKYISDYVIPRFARFFK